MADIDDANAKLATALNDLGTAVQGIQNEVEAGTSEISSLVQQLLQAAGSGESDQVLAFAAQIEARAGDINAASTRLGDAISAATAPPSTTISTSLSSGTSTSVSSAVSTSLSSGVSTVPSTVLSSGVSTSLSTTI